jgi:NAD(P)-dependent dehydrogenase (short-subunit alcohol dehydrogenase family)
LPTVLVNNAGLNRIGPSEDLEEALFQEVVDVNLTGALRCCQVAGRRMLTEGRGSIVNIGSINAEVGMPGRAAYCASKAGLIGLTRVLAVEWASRGVRVNAVEPGYVRTPMVENAIAQGLLSEQAMRDRTPLDRLAEPGEIARTVVFLASKDAAYITGQTLAVDGGYLAYGAPGPASEIPTSTYSP